MGATNPAIRLLTVDDHPLMRAGVAALIGSEPDIAIVAEASDGREAIEQFRVHCPDITLMDLQMPGMRGAETITAIRAEFPDARIIVLTTYSGEVQALRAIKAGASGSMLRKELLETIRAVHAGQRRIPAEIANEIVGHVNSDALTEPEIQVVRGIAAGNANKAIAGQLGIAEETVKGHVKNMLAKLGANDRTHAAMIAVKRSIIES
jgi:DNA-binding NarL/FixJ family response regulator